METTHHRLLSEILAELDVLTAEQIEQVQVLFTGRGGVFLKRPEPFGLVGSGSAVVEKLVIK